MCITLYDLYISSYDLYIHKCAIHRMAYIFIRNFSCIGQRSKSAYNQTQG